MALKSSRVLFKGISNPYVATWPRQSFSLCQIIKVTQRGGTSQWASATQYRRASSKTIRQSSSIEERLKEERLTASDKENLKGHFSFTTTNSLKLVIPMPDKEDVVAFLLHTQQPLSYLETLLRHEFPIEKQPRSIKFLDIYKHARWSTSVQISDFIREAAATKRFCIEIQEGSKEVSSISVNVPSFHDRTHFLRTRLGKLSETLQVQHQTKSDCDSLAQQTARNYALMGMGGLVSYWILVYHLTFNTSLGWDTMEPATYLCGLSALISGYCWFLYHNRDVSYSSVLHTAATVRQQRLYKEKGFDIVAYRDLIEEGKELRKEIQRVAAEYNVEWSAKEDKYISDFSSLASNVIKREEKKEARKGGYQSSREKDLEDDGKINGSNEEPPTKRTSD